MKILAVGGGSGGHVTPVAAVLRELRRRDTQLEIRFWCDRKFVSHAKNIMAHFDPTLPVQTIYSGKLRRYNNIPLWQNLLRPSIALPNIRDMVLVGVGFLQSLIKLILWRPDVIFAKGGFVCLPVGVAAKVLRIPLVIHDSDAHPGLTNRILARWATAIATGAPLEHYSYPKDRSTYVGIPVSTEFAPFSETRRRHAKETLGLDTKAPLVVVTGGGLGAQKINDAVVTCLDELLAEASVVLISGSAQYDDIRALTMNRSSKMFQLYDFVSKDMSAILGAADIVVARAGATTILELAALATPTILIPNGYLTGGHQLKNAEVYRKKLAVRVIDEHELDRNPQTLVEEVRGLLLHPETMKQLSVQFHSFARPHAARDMADIIVRHARGA